MKNQQSLYFDLWRKRNFKQLLSVYTQAAYRYNSKQQMISGFGELLDEFMEEGRGQYKGNSKSFSSAYTLGRELGIFKSANSTGGYELSKLAQAYLDSKILASEYMFVYMMNSHQLINGVVVHPVKEILNNLKILNGEITKEEIRNIESFKLSNRTIKNQRQIVNILCYRLVEAEILEPVKKNLYKVNRNYSIEELISNCLRLDITAEQFEKLTHEQFVNLLSTQNKLIKAY